MKLLEKTNEEILEIANPIWDNLVKASNVKDYSGFTKDFSSQMLFGANEVELGKQWANNKLLTSLSDKKEVLPPGAAQSSRIFIPGFGLSALHENPVLSS